LFEQVSRIGLAGVTDRQPIGMGEMAMAAAAVLRLVRRKKTHR